MPIRTIAVVALAASLIGPAGAEDPPLRGEEVKAGGAAAGLDDDGLTDEQRLAAEKRKAFMVTHFESELAEVEVARVAATKARDQQKMKSLLDRKKALKSQVESNKAKSLAEHHADLVEEVRKMAEADRRQKAEAAAAPKQPRGKWYEGGTLHQKNGLAWQSAPRDDRLATCADIVAKAWQSKLLKDHVSRNIRSIDDMRPYAEQLCAYLDKAFAADPDAARNRRLYTNQQVTGFAAIGMSAMGWIK